MFEDMYSSPNAFAYFWLTLYEDEHAQDARASRRLAELGSSSNELQRSIRIPSRKWAPPFKGAPAAFNTPASLVQ